MTKKILIIILLVIYSCHSEKKKGRETFDNLDTKQVKKEFNNKVDSSISGIQNNLMKDTIQEKSFFNIEYIKNNTSKFKDKVKIEDDSAKTTIPKKFLENYFSNKEIKIGYPKFLTSYYPESYFFQNFKEYENFILFTFSHFDESCCQNLYAVTSKKDSINVMNIGLISYMGADGGWIGEKYGEWENDSIIKTITYSEYDEDFIEDNNNTKIDTTWSVIKIDKNGIITEKIIDSVNYIGNKKIE
ncbi:MULTISPECIES: hypothetical protein [Mesonia]|uniref:Uncharacterized protein n=1 Tax=Mesonia oceanica TaxID=2687242 RepID=A0AC61YAP6_9FLAO|nr:MULTISPECIES: hypothetical protein [Mesonia]MAN29343.1 hypothetical protein [Mesonia sp.]MAQ41626.1 hypothetical protein [Mesonia sp.]VVV01464.1 hypothetical protein FVB9532_02756 [Mesonia oceanica]|tara:strand:+ start:502 stop:1233 length:732 start_codon:yes stop_codon:yes gene_type:complete